MKSKFFIDKPVDRYCQNAIRKTINLHLFKITTMNIQTKFPIV